MHLLDAAAPKRGAAQRANNKERADIANHATTRSRNQQADSLTEEQVSEFKEAFSLFVSCRAVSNSGFPHQGPPAPGSPLTTALYNNRTRTAMVSLFPFPPAYVHPTQRRPPPCAVHMRDIACLSSLRFVRVRTA